ncbi:MAG: CHASE2 domain-containing protein [Acidobacteriaceae bacterium]|nr:CHASE2 domain-containing protein [Acidobacteriaceae bacterium]MBV9778371.1 CHASE2 domain-containing protein [Acidobacteriaceae bacterium]
MNKALSDRHSRAIVRTRFHHILRDSFTALILTVALAWLKGEAEKLQRFAFLEEYLYDWLQFNLKPIEPKQRIVVVDFEDFPMANGYTSRTALASLMDTVVHAGPLAVGLDVDFSPLQRGRFYTNEDKLFLEQCLRWQEALNGSLFVGVHSSLKFGPQYWLVDSRYKDLAAYVGRANPGEYGPNHLMDESVKIPSSETELQEIPSLGGALARVFRNSRYIADPSDPPGWLAWALKRTETEEDTAHIIYQQFWVDFSPIDYFRDNAVHVYWRDQKVQPRDPRTLSAHDLAGKIVLLGRGLLPRGTEQVDEWESEASDKFPVPGHADQYAGVLLHACAAYTLLGNDLRLLHLTEPGRIALDALFSLLVFGFVAAIRLIYICSSETVNIHRLNRVVTVGAMVLVFILGDVMLNYTRWLWDDYLLVMFVLAVHSWLENHEEWATEAVHWTGEMWRKLVLQSEPEKHAGKKAQ